MQVNNTPDAPAPSALPAFTMTESAAARIKQLRNKESKPELRFRVTVKGGGCSGFQYDFALDDTPPAPADILVNVSGAEAITDDVSITMLAGSVLDYTEDLSHAGFEIKNPNAASSCGCGNSFSVKL
jgi:iron-sulfur cluster insertion protein